MSLSKIVKAICPKCGKTAIEKSRLTIGKSKLLTLECGHVVPESTLGITDYTSIVASDGSKLMPFQARSVEFAEQANANCLIAHEQGLGKTVIANAILALHKDKLFPAVAVTKTTIRMQWLWSVMNWTGTKKVQVIQSSKDIAIPGFDIYIVTYDMLKSDVIFAAVELKTMILDECQAIKNHLSGRAKAVQDMKANHKIEHIIALSGTPIKNNAGEYFTVLNLLKPTRFPEYKRYLNMYCDSYETMYGYKVGGLSNVESFRADTNDFILRYTQAEVLPDLFALKQPRKFHHVELDKKLNKAYESASAELEALFYADENENTMTAMIAVMTKMRQITGVSKVTECVDYLTDFILSTDRKICVFVHHHVVMDMLEANINNWLRSGGYKDCVAYRAGDNREDKLNLLKDNNCRVLLASSLASGEGFDGLQHLCSDMIMLERQWNPANEEQVEGRIARIGQTKPVNFTYMIASETIDEYFTELVEQKRAIMSQTLDGKEMQWETNSLMRELAQVLVTKGKKSWRL